MVPLPLSAPIWDAFFTVAPLVLVGTREEDGSHDLAPKHMAMPLGWQNHFGFVCHPSHATQRNAERTGAFTVSFPRPASVVWCAFLCLFGSSFFSPSVRPGGAPGGPPTAGCPDHGGRLRAGRGAGFSSGGAAAGRAARETHRHAAERGARA